MQLTRDLCAKVLSILSRKQLMYLDYDEFNETTGACRKIFNTWEDQFESFRETLRDLARKRNQEKLPLRVLIHFHLAK